MRTATRVGKSILTSALLLGLMAASMGPAMANQLPVIDDVRISQTLLSPGEELAISYRLAKDARVTALVYTPDYQVVRLLMDDIARPAGTNTLQWDGRDDKGNMVPDEAYLFSLQAKDNAGNLFAYDPTSFSGGGKADIRVESMTPMPEGYEIRFSVQTPSRVSMRAGIHNGPLFATIVNWAPYDKGAHTLYWNGMDTTGTLRAMDQDGAILLPQGFQLPENSIIVNGGNQDYIAYSKALEALQTTTTGVAVITVSTVRKSSLERTTQGVSTSFLVSRARHNAPRFEVKDPTGSPLASTRKTAAIPVSNHYPLTMEVNAEDVEDFYEGRYEIVVFVDNQRFDEEESAQTPYTYVLDTTSLENGIHQVTFNLAGLGGQVESYSFTIDVNNN
ncbi:MAG: hypothetical protein JEZ02_20095 [Desulfatibacillum sp.]|nr:hypothetical protein [Desulfatibacillum sp.]